MGFFVCEMKGRFYFVMKKILIVSVTAGHNLILPKRIGELFEIKTEIISLEDFELPFFGADFVTLPSGHLLALDLQPAIKYDKLYNKDIETFLIIKEDYQL